MPNSYTCHLHTIIDTLSHETMPFNETKEPIQGNYKDTEMAQFYHQTQQYHEIYAWFIEYML